MTAEIRLAFSPRFVTQVRKESARHALRILRKLDRADDADAPRVADRDVSSSPRPYSETPIDDNATDRPSA